MKIKLIICIVFFSFFHLKSDGQELLPRLNIRCDSVSKTSIAVTWDSLVNVLEYQLFVDLPGLPAWVRDTVVDNFFEIRNLNRDGQLSYEFEVTTRAEPGFINKTQTVTCNRLICPPLTIDLPAEQDRFCLQKDSNHLIQPIVGIPASAPGGSWGNGEFSFSGVGVDSAGRLNIKDFAPGLHQLSVSYEERDCSYAISTPFRIHNPAPVEVSCIYNEFLNSLGITWDRRHIATSYQININDSLIIVQNPIGYFYKPQFIGENVNIKILPISDKGCKYEEAETTCIAAVWTNSKDSFEEEFVSISPNPSTGIFEIGSDKRVEKVEVFDISGKKRKEVFDSKIDLSEFNSGIYFLKIHIENNVILKKVVKI